MSQCRLGCVWGEAGERRDCRLAGAHTRACILVDGRECWFQLMGVASPLCKGITIMCSSNAFNFFQSVIHHLLLHFNLTGVL